MNKHSRQIYGWTYQAVKVMHAFDVGEEAPAVLFGALKVPFLQATVKSIRFRNDTGTI